MNWFVKNGMANFRQIGPVDGDPEYDGWKNFGNLWHN